MRKRSFLGLGDRRVRWGVAFGVAAALVLVGGMCLGGIALRGSALSPGGPLLSDCDGAVEELVIQYVPSAGSVVGTAYREFLGQLPADVTVRVVCPDVSAYDEFREYVGDPLCALRPIYTNHPMTTWARDRWLALGPAVPGGRTTLVAPREENAAEIWPERMGDRRIAADIAVALPEDVQAKTSRLACDGGDFVADNETVFITPAVRRRNVGSVMRSVAELKRALGSLLKRRVVLLTDAPPHHAGMFMMTAGNRTVVVGDPEMGRALFESNAGTCSLIENPDFGNETRRRFQAVADACAAEGYRVVRIPVVPDADGRTYLTYLNVIVNGGENGPVVHMPVYRGATALNDAAEQVWRDLGFSVRRVDCTETYRRFGSLRCLVNVLRRSTLLRKRD